MSRGSTKITVVFPTPINDGDVRPIPRQAFPDMPTGIQTAPVPKRTQAPVAKNPNGIFKRMFAGLF